MSDAFPGFPAKTLAFLKGLKANINRDWFAANKPIYERAVKQPAGQFCEAMTQQLQMLTGINHTAKAFRIHRDIRFSKDKTPNNAHLHISFIPQTGLAAPPAWFFGLAPGQLTLGTGIFSFDKQTLDIFRDRVDGKDGPNLALQIDALFGKCARVSEPELKRVPASYLADHPRAGLLRHKGPAVLLDVADIKAGTGPKAVTTSLAGFKQVKPVFDWLLDLES